MIAHDVRRTNDAIDRLLAVTTNPRHRFLLQAFYRHRFLEIAGRYEEIFAPEMMCDSPVYHFDYAKMNARVVGNGTTLDTQVVGGSYWSKVPGLLYITVPSDVLDSELTVLALSLDGPVQLFHDEVKPIESN